MCAPAIFGPSSRTLIIRYSHRLKIPMLLIATGVLTGQILEIEDTYVMLYAGKKGQEWQTGLATLRED